MRDKITAISTIVTDAALTLVSATLFAARPTVISGICFIGTLVCLIVTDYIINKGGFAK